MSSRNSVELSETKYIFIVGASRSGTSLIRRILNSSSQIAICDETHFLGHFVPAEGMRYRLRKFGDLSDDGNARRLVDFIYSDEFETSSKYRYLSWQWRWIIDREKKEDFLQRVFNSDRSERSLFDIIMQIFADKWAKPIKGEKTPINLRYVTTLMEWFPEAKIIHMLRDPRGVFVSDLRRRRESPITPPFKQLKQFDFFFKLYVLLHTTVIWSESVIRYTKHQKNYPHSYYLLKFEALVNNPEVEIKQLCKFLRVEFQDKMLEQTVISKGFEAGQAGFDTKAATRWKEHIDPWINYWLVFWFRRYLEKFGYLD